MTKICTCIGISSYLCKWRNIRTNFCLPPSLS